MHPYYCGKLRIVGSFESTSGPVVFTKIHLLKGKNTTCFLFPTEGQTDRLTKTDKKEIQSCEKTRHQMCVHAKITPLNKKFILCVLPPPSVDGKIFLHLQQCSLTLTLSFTSGDRLAPFFEDIQPNRALSKKCEK